MNLDYKNMDMTLPDSKAWSAQWGKRKSGPSAYGYRTYDQVDRARIIHSQSFRRLQAKTQVLEMNESDFHRTRLTHSIEVAQISTGLVAHLKYQFPEYRDYLPSDNLIEAISLAHDLGHPPFGHGGEIALNYMMKDANGFEGNAQTLRILTRLEKFSERYGMNLSKRTLLGILKYPINYSKAKQTAPPPPKDQSFFHQLQLEDWLPPKCFYNEEQTIINWLLEDVSQTDQTQFLSIRKKENAYSKSKYKTLDCSIMELADDISYSVHDFEDAMELGLIEYPDILAFLDSLKDKINDKHFSFKHQNDPSEYTLDNLTQDILYHKKLKKAVSILIGYLVDNTRLIQTHPTFSDPIFSINAQLTENATVILSTLKSLIREKVIGSPKTQRMIKNGQIILCKLFDALSSDPALLPISTQQKLTYKDPIESKRVICDYVSGMTNNYALKMYNRIFSPQFNSIFEL